VDRGALGSGRGLSVTCSSRGSIRCRESESSGTVHAPVGRGKNPRRSGARPARRIAVVTPRKAVVSLLLLVFAASACGTTFRPPAAVVRGADITDGQLRESIPLFRFLASLRQAPCGNPSRTESAESACSRFVLTQLVTERLVRAYATAHGVTVSSTDVLDAIIPLEQQMGGHAALVKQLRAQGLSFADLRELAERLLLVQKVAQTVASNEISPRELHAQYRRDAIQFTIVHAAHILVHNHRAAVKIAAEATPQNFAELARRYSKDPGSAPRGGDLGETLASQLDPTFVRAALSLRPGQISGPVHTQFGWHVIMLISVRRVPFSQARGRIVGQLAGQAFTSWLRRQYASGSIDVNPRYGRFDPKQDQILPITCTAATPSSSCSA
jgi:PPIC-type PPIASE domain/SurA N-terminal domain